MMCSAVAVPRSFRDIPGPRRLPGVGTLYLYQLGKYKIEEYHKVLVDLYHKYGPLVREDLGVGGSVVHVFDPDDAEKVYSNEGKTPFVSPLQETTKFYRKERNLSPGLGNTNGEEWYRLRSAVRQMMLRPKEVQNYLPIVNKTTEQLVSRIFQKRDHQTGQLPNIRDEMAKWSRETSGWVCFEKSLGCMDGGEAEEEAQRMIDANKRIFQLSSQLKFSLPIFRHLRTPKWRRLMKTEDVFHGSGARLVRSAIENIETIAGQETHGENRYNFLKYLLSRPELSHKDIEIVTLSLFTDALSTTVPSLLYNLYCLAVNPRVQEKVLEEVSAATGKGKDISVETINNKLPYLKAFIKETFRFYPIGTDVARIIQSDHVFSNYHVPKGTIVQLNQFVHFQSDEYFKDAKLFQPERWLRGTGDEVHPILLLPFGHGARTCAGRRFAEQDLYVAISKLLMNFRLDYPKDEPPLEQVFRTLLFPKEPLQIQFIPRL